jgi:hypothetical protein
MPYVLGIDHVAFAAHDLESDLRADDRALRRPLPQAAIHSTECYKGLSSTFLSLTAGTGGSPCLNPNSSKP